MQDVLESYLRGDLAKELGAYRSRYTCIRNHIKVVYLDRDGNQFFELRGVMYEGTLVLDFVKTYTDFRNTGLCRVALNFIQTTASMSVGIFQVVSSVLYALCIQMKLEKTDFTEQYGINRDDVCTTGRYYTEDYGDFYLRRV